MPRKLPLLMPRKEPDEMPRKLPLLMPRKEPDEIPRKLPLLMPRKEPDEMPSVLSSVATARTELLGVPALAPTQSTAKATHVDVWPTTFMIVVIRSSMQRVRRAFAVLPRRAGSPYSDYVIRDNLM